MLLSKLTGDVDKKMKAMSTIMYAIRKDGFGIEEQKRRKIRP